MATSKRSLPIVTGGQRPAYSSIVDRVMAKLAKLDPAKMKLKSSTSAKIDADGAGIAWSLPAGPRYSCPGATADCTACYAQQGHHVRDNVATALATNWLRFRYLESIGDIEAAALEILRDVISPVLGIFRIHESGDFHSQWAVDVWTEVARRKPRLAIWSYTRSFDFDFTRFVALPNVRLYASTDSQNLREAQAFIRAHSSRVAHAFGPYIPGEKLPARSYECPPTADKYLVKLGRTRKPFGHESACARCRACIPDETIEKPRHIVFYSHARSQASTGFPGDDLGSLGTPPRRTSNLALTVHAPGLAHDGCIMNDGDPIHFP